MSKIKVRNTITGQVREISVPAKTKPKPKPKAKAKGVGAGKTTQASEVK